MTPTVPLLSVECLKRAAFWTQEITQQQIYYKNLVKVHTARNNQQLIDDQFPFVGNICDGVFCA